MGPWQFFYFSLFSECSLYTLLLPGEPLSPQARSDEAKQLKAEAQYTLLLDGLARVFCHSHGKASDILCETLWVSVSIKWGAWVGLLGRLLSSLHSSPNVLDLWINCLLSGHVFSLFKVFGFVHLLEERAWQFVGEHLLSQRCRIRHKDRHASIMRVKRSQHFWVETKTTAHLSLCRFLSWANGNIPYDYSTL